MDVSFSTPDVTCLAQGAVFSTDPAVTGINSNEIAVGGTGAGKTVSIAGPRLAHARDKSQVVVLTKRKLFTMFKGSLEKKGYDVDVIDLVKPECSTVGYDPLKHVRTEDEVVNLADALSMFGKDRKDGSKDPFWPMMGRKALECLMNLEIENAKADKREHAMKNVFKLFNNLKWKARGGCSINETTLDPLFDELEKIKPGNSASAEWNGIFTGNADNTAGCIKAETAAMLHEIKCENILKIMEMDEQIDFSTFDQHKRALFIITSSTKTVYNNFLNLFYTQMFDELITLAENKENQRLDIPVHFIADDFACGAPIKNFPELISVFRASGISATLLLQSESQLAAIYGENDAKTIINNCDTYVYMGGNDLKTIESISERANKPVITIASLPLGQVYVFRRGSKPYCGERYRIFEDPLYKEIAEEYEQKTCRSNTLVP